MRYESTSSDERYRQIVTRKVDESQAAERHLRYFLGKHSTWRERGLPWRVYAPGKPFDREISSLDAIARLRREEPVVFQRMRVVTVTPDLKALEALATNVAAPPPLRGLVSNVSKAKKEAQVQPDPSGWEMPFGYPTTLSSFGELQLFSAIYNEEVSITIEDQDDPNSQEIADHISTLMNRTLQSGLDFFENELSFVRRFLFYCRRESLFWIPASCAVVVPSLLSSTIMSSLFGREPLSILPKAKVVVAQIANEDTTVSAVGGATDISTSSSLFSSLVSSPTLEGHAASTLDFVAINGGALGAAVCVGIIATASRSAWLATFTPLGKRVSAFRAFERIRQREPIVIQEVQMNTLRVPFVTTISWFSRYRPGDKCESVEDLRALRSIYLGK